MTDLETQLNQMGEQARAAAYKLATLSSTRKNAILHAMAEGIDNASQKIIAENAKDLAAAEAKGLAPAMIDRLRIDESGIGKIATGIREVAVLADPVGETLSEWDRPNGLHFKKIRTPIGVIGIIYESRPNVTSDASVLCLKTGNAVILRGGSEAFYSNSCIASVLQASGRKAGLPDHSIQLVPTTDREAVSVLCKMNRWIDVMIPRGGESLIERVMQDARMPVIKHYNGICHVFVDASADFSMAEQIIINGKCQRPGVCNAVETLLIHRTIAADFLPHCASLLVAQGVELRGDETVCSLLGEKTLRASDADWTTEYLALILSIRIVDSLNDAIDHINRYGSHHSDAIVTSDEKTASAFLQQVDSATVYWNASTRFSDGGEFGFGAEIGISTDKLHARGPVALPELTTYKYLVCGNGQTRP